MQDLSDVAGLPLYLDGNRLSLGEPSEVMTAARTRRVDTLSELWRDPSVSGGAEVYSTYQPAWKPEHQVLFEEWGVDHGYVVMVPGTFGGEYGKLYGHYHPPVASRGLASPELQMVLYGTAHFLLQESLPPYEEVTDVVVVEARAGDRFLVPPNYGHLAINPGHETLVFEGFLIRGLEAAYEPYKRRRGGAYYEVMGADHQAEWLANSNYRHLPPLRHVRARDVFSLQGLGAGSCYEQFVRTPQRFEFLNRPEEFRPEWRL